MGVIRTEYARCEPCEVRPTEALTTRRALLPILQAHVRLAWQTGNHLNVLSISADDPTRTFAVLPPD